MNGSKRFSLIAAMLLIAPLALFAIGTGPSNEGARASGAGAGASGRSASGAGASMTGPAMSADDFYNAGVALSDAGRHPEALVQFQKAVAARSDFAEAFNMIGFTYRMLGNYRLSLQSYEKALSLKPDFPQAHEYLGETYLAANDLLHAMQNYLILKKAGRPEANELWDKITGFVDEKTQTVASR